MGGVGAHVPALVVTVKNQIQSHQLVILRIVNAHHVGEVRTPIQPPNSSDPLSVLISPAIDIGGNGRKLSQKVHHVFIHGIPQLGLGNALIVLPYKLGTRLKRENANGELSHGMHICRQRLKNPPGLFGHLRPSLPFLGDLPDLFLFGKLTGQKQPEDPLRQRLFSTRRLGQLLPDFRDGVSAEPYSLHGVKKRSLPHHAFYSPHATVGLSDSCFRDDLVAVLLNQGLDLLP